MTRIILALMMTLAAAAAQAKVEFVGPDWAFGGTTAETIQVVGISSDANGETTIVLNFANSRQIKLSGAHTPLGLSLTGFQGKCVKIIPGYEFQSVSFILSCN